MKSWLCSGGGQTGSGSPGPAGTPKPSLGLPLPDRALTICSFFHSQGCSYSPAGRSSFSGSRLSAAPHAFLSGVGASGHGVPSPGS